MADELTFSPYARELSPQLERLHRLLIMSRAIPLIDFVQALLATSTKAKRNSFAKVAALIWLPTANQLSASGAARSH
jgi:hypothetical protein